MVLLDRKWNEKRYLLFELDDIGRREETTLQAMSVLLHEESLCVQMAPASDQLDETHTVTRVSEIEICPAEV